MAVECDFPSQEYITEMLSHFPDHSLHTQFCKNDCYELTKTLHVMCNANDIVGLLSIENEIVELLSTEKGACAVHVYLAYLKFIGRSLPAMKICGEPLKPTPTLSGAPPSDDVSVAHS